MGVLITTDGGVKEIAPPENKLFFNFNEMRRYLHCKVFKSIQIWDGNYIVYNPDYKCDEVNLVAAEIAVKGVHNLQNALIKYKRLSRFCNRKIDFKKHYGKYLITGNVLIIEKDRIIIPDL
ncbi:MAG: hypothetical protein MI922_01805 [Bacteroidales bacterium]|nr:hypothetical protein [Bacteroidales bacterium]